MQAPPSHIVTHFGAGQAICSLQRRNIPVKVVRLGKNKSMRLQMAGEFRQRSTEALDKALTVEDPAERGALIDQAVFWNERAIAAEAAARETAIEPGAERGA